jgi:hypothetical protein
LRLDHADAVGGVGIEIRPPGSERVRIVGRSRGSATSVVTSVGSAEPIATNLPRAALDRRLMRSEPRFVDSSHRRERHDLPSRDQRVVEPWP